MVIPSRPVTGAPLRVTLICAMLKIPLDLLIQVVMKQSLSLLLLACQYPEGKDFGKI
jgi:hypothetical protein